MYSVAQGGSPRDQAITDLAWIAFFFLLRPREYCFGGTDTVSTPFTLHYIKFFVVTQHTQSTKASPVTCATATFISLLFTTQKMVSKENLSNTAQQDTPAHVRWQTAGAVWHTYDNTATPPPQTRILLPFSTEKDSPQYAAQNHRSTPFRDHNHRTPSGFHTRQ